MREGGRRRSQRKRRPRSLAAPLAASRVLQELQLIDAVKALCLCFGISLVPGQQISKAAEMDMHGW